MFNYNFDKRTLYIIVAVIALISLRSYANNQSALLSLLITLPAVIIAITFHEFAHAYAAYKLGDDTPKIQGRLSLNPLSHLDPVGSLLLIFAHVGWGKPVEINPRNFDRKYSMSAGEAIVSIAGPGMNFFLAIIFTVIYCIIVKFATSFLLTQAGNIVIMFLQSIIVINIGLGVFNLIPIPPLDGSKIFRNFMSYNVKAWFDKYERVFYGIFLVLWVTGFLGDLISPIISWIAIGLMKLVGMLFGIL